jgi:signal-transduction protein with cAMP-binding, CBS, and nucleotidyltransferase domain
MARTVADVMTRDPITMPSEATIVEAAKQMKQNDIGAVVVTDDGSANGIVTDRDIVVRAVADGADLQRTTLRNVCSGEVTSVSPKDRVERAVELMRQKAVRRVLVTRGNKPVGIVSIGDLAMEQDPESALADIRVAPGNE